MKTCKVCHTFKAVEGKEICESCFGVLTHFKNETDKQKKEHSLEELIQIARDEWKNNHVVTDKIHAIIKLISLKYPHASITVVNARMYVEINGKLVH